MLVFGSLLAAWIPLMLGLQAVIATVGLTAIVSHITPMDPNVSAVVMLVGLAVGVDYTLFYLRREREERAAGRSERAALEAAAATSGRSVLISGITVLIAMAGMLFSGDKTFISMSIGTMMVVAVAMIGSLTVLPGGAFEARRSGREGTHPAARQVPRPGWRGEDLVANPESGASPAGDLGGAQRGPAGHAGGACPADPHGVLLARTRCLAARRRWSRSTASRRRSRARRARP